MFKAATLLFGNSAIRGVWKSAKIIGKAVFLRVAVNVANEVNKVAVGVYGDSVEVFFK